jgi:Flp pilus assembly protein TadD
MGRGDEAARELARAVALNPENADAHFNLAMLLGPRGEVEAAIAHLQRVIAIDPRHADAYRNLAMALGLRGRLNDALVQAHTARRLAPGSREIAQLVTQLEAAAARR